MQIHRKTIAAVGVASVLAAGAAIPAIAQDDATEDTTTSDDASTFGERRAEHLDELAAALADELGLETADVVDALEAVHEQMRAERRAAVQERIQARLDELVESGELTREEADTLADIQDRGVLRGAFGRGPGGPGHHRADGVTTDAAA